MSGIDVRCREVAGGWDCDVVVRHEGESRHRVRVGIEDLRRLDPAATDPQRLVRESFAFLLEREPKESILVRFDLPVIERYFPGYELEIRRRLADSDASRKDAGPGAPDPTETGR
ncbi:MAG TPA: hypothetical protein VEY67_06810 [Candidatus Dormibacteraeota bacterium]|nr:hypothetical protein [Candidatus Dormibacteraeota bacterium]